MKKELKRFYLYLPFVFLGCPAPGQTGYVQTVVGYEVPDPKAIWLSHEHILVDFIGADSVNPSRWVADSVIKEVTPFLEPLKKHNVQYFIDATPNYLARDVRLLQQIAQRSGLKILTNTGLYGARNNKYIPEHAFEMTPMELAEMWVGEFRNGIDGTTIKPGFIKIGIDATDTLDPMHVKLVEAAALTHLQTGLTIASHTGPAIGLWPQLQILKEKGVAPGAFIWVHAQNEKVDTNYLRAAKLGCWISLDGLGWELDRHIQKLLFAKENEILDRVLISHDAGWYDPDKEEQSIKSYTNIFEKLYPELIANGFTHEEFNLIISNNPAKAFVVKIKKDLN